MSDKKELSLIKNKAPDVRDIVWDSYENGEQLIEKEFNDTDEVVDFLDLLGCDINLLETIEATLYLKKNVLSDNNEIIPLTVKNAQGKIVFAKDLRGERELMNIIKLLRYKKQGGAVTNKISNTKTSTETHRGESQLFFEQMVMGKLEKDNNVAAVTQALNGIVGDYPNYKEEQRLNSFFEVIKPIEVEKIPVLFLRVLANLRDVRLQVKFIQKIDFKKIVFDDLSQVRNFFVTVSEYDAIVQNVLIDSIPNNIIRKLGVEEVLLLDPIDVIVRKKILSTKISLGAIDISEVITYLTGWGLVIANWLTDSQKEFLEKINSENFQNIKKMELVELLRLDTAILTVFLKKLGESLSIEKKVFLNNTVMDNLAFKDGLLQEVIVRGLEDNSVDSLTVLDISNISGLSNFAKVILFTEKLQKGIITPDFLQKEEVAFIMSSWDKGVLSIIQSPLVIKK